MLSASLAIEDQPFVADTASAGQPMPDPDLLRQEWLARESVYRVLSGVFVEEPSIPLLIELRQPVFLAALQQAGIDFGSDFLNVGLVVLHDHLACEYATLFASSGGFPPVESVRLMGRFKQEPHYQVLQTYQRLGFEQRPGRFEVFADQLGVELAFVAELLRRGTQALEAGDMTTFKRMEKEIKRFWALHLGRWVRGYAGLIQRASTHSFYRGMARFLAGFANEEIVALGLSNLDDLDQGQLEVPKAEIKLEFDPDEPVCGECTPRRAEGGAARVIPITPMQDFQL